jgi:hypothetical protein
MIKDKKLLSNKLNVQEKSLVCVENISHCLFDILSREEKELVV